MAIQAERFMGKPEENLMDYERTELMKSAHLLKGRTFMIVHGTSDRRVNIQHSMQLIKSLTNNAVQFQTQVSGHYRCTNINYLFSSFIPIPARSKHGTCLFVITFIAQWKISLQNVSKSKTKKTKMIFCQ